MARMPHHDLVAPSCPRRSSEHSRQTSSPRVPAAVSSNLASRFIQAVPSQDRQAFKYALGTLEFRKQRNRKRTSTGEYVWTDEADLIFALALIAWTSDRSNRVGTRRAVFLQQYLTRYGFTKTRKQIASRLQVLKGEWSCSSYMDLLQDPDSPDIPRRHRSSSFSSLRSERSSASLLSGPVTSPSPPVSSAPSIHGAERNSYAATVSLAFHEESESFRTAPLSPLDFQAPRHGSFEQACAHSFDQRGQGMDSFSRFEAPNEMTGHQFPHHAIVNPFYTSGYHTAAPIPTLNLAAPFPTLPTPLGLPFHDKRTNVPFDFTSHVSAPGELSSYNVQSGELFYPFSY